jgi:hypothetical protein
MYKIYIFLTFFCKTKKKKKKKKKRKWIKVLFSYIRIVENTKMSSPIQ